MQTGIGKHAEDKALTATKLRCHAAMGESHLLVEKVFSYPLASCTPVEPKDFKQSLITPEAQNTAEKVNETNSQDR